MSIASKRLTAKLDAMVRDAMKSGMLPDPVIIRGELEIFLREHSLDSPTATYRPQPERGTFSVDSYNSMVSEVVEDLGFAFAEQIDQANRVLHAVNEAEIKHKAFLHQIDTLDDLLEVLLLAEPKATGYFYAIIDFLRDLSTVDQSATTAQVDLSSGCAHLPMLKSSRKVPMPHMADKRVPRVVSDTDVVSQEVVMMPYSAVFDDTARGWLHKIDLASPDGWSGYLDIPAAETDPRVDVEGQGVRDTERKATEIYISRIDIEGLTDVAPIEIKVLLSVDGENYLSIPGYDWTELGGRRLSFFFERTRVEYLRLLLRKSTPDEEKTGNSYSYLIGLKNVSLYDAGFSREAVFQSKELDPDVGEDIGRVVLDVDETLPSNTSIEYYVAPYASSPLWRRIQPLSRAQADALPVLDFSDAVLSSRKDNQIDVTSTPVTGAPKNGIFLYPITTLNGSQIGDSVKVYRGVDGWKWSRNTVERVVQVKDNYVVFTQDDNFQQLYREIEDETVTPPASDGVNHTVITLSREILYDTALNTKATDNAAGTIPNYMIRRVQLQKQSPTSGAVTVDVREGQDDNLATSVWRQVFVSLGVLTVSDVKVGDSVYLTQGTENGFFRVARVSVAESGYVTIVVDDPDRVLVSGAATWLHNVEDITALVVDVAGSTFRVDSSVTLTVNDRLLVSYRSPLNEIEIPVSSSIVVKPVEAAGSAFKLGADYVYDPELKGVSRNPEGNIVGGTDGNIVVRVDFEYKHDASVLDTYTTWLRYEGDGSRIDMGAALSLDSQAGEAVLLRTNSQQVIDLSRVTEIDGLAAGWRQLIVKSKPAVDTDGNLDVDTALYKIVNATDANGRLLVGPTYFSEKRGFKASLNQVSWFRLQTAISKDDHTFFALNGNSVVVNYDPTRVKDILYLTPGGSVTHRERFEVEYMYQPSGAQTVQSLLFKAVLRRNEGCPADRTPVLRGYKLRIAH